MPVNKYEILGLFPKTAGAGLDSAPATALSAGFASGVTAGLLATSPAVAAADIANRASLLPGRTSSAIGNIPLAITAFFLDGCFTFRCERHTGQIHDRSPGSSSSLGAGRDAGFGSGFRITGSAFFSTTAPVDSGFRKTTVGSSSLTSAGFCTGRSTGIAGFTTSGETSSTRGISNSPPHPGQPIFNPA